MQRSGLEQFVKTSASDLGFDLAGIAPAGPFREHEYFPQWIADGRHGEMRYLESRAEDQQLKRASLASVAPWARSVIVCAVNYNSDAPYSTACPDPSHGWISRYAWGRADYHDVLLPRLRELEARLKERVSISGSEVPRTWCYVDTGPLIERVFAEHAGIGWIGKNTCVINQQVGSWIFLGVILTSLPLTPDLPAPDRCGSCTRCLDACPTNAFPAAYQLDASRCISYLTIEKRGDIPEDLREGIGRHIFGCDICQDVCPWNRKAPVSPLPQFAPRTELVNPSLDWISGMNVEEFREAFRGSPVKRTKHSGLLRNAAVAMGNSGNARFIPALLGLATGDDPVVAEHARWALRKLGAAEPDRKETGTP